MGPSHKSQLRKALPLLAGMAALLQSGCLGTAFLPPIPVPAWVPDRIEEKLMHKNDNRTPLLPPIPPGFTPKCEDAPDVQAVLRAMPRVARGLPGIYEEFRDDMDFAFERLVDHIDPPRFFPLIGFAQLHHCHWKVTVYYTETISVGYPIPWRTTRRRVEVMYMDLDHLHPYTFGQEEQRELGRAFTGPPI